MEESPKPASARRWVIALAVVLVIPMVAFAIGMGVEARYQGEMTSAIEAELGRSLTPAERSEYTVSAYCADPQYSSDSVCGDLALASVARTVAVGSGALGLLLLAFIAFAAWRARRDRAALLRLFLPGLYVTLLGLAVLVITDGILVIASVYLGFGVFLGRVYPILILAVAVGVVLGAGGMVRAILRARHRATTLIIGRRVAADEEAGLHELIADIAARLGSGPPEHVFVGLDPTFFVTEADVVATDGRFRGRSLYLSLTLSEILTPPELRAVLGHEMGHFRGSDTEFSRRFYPVYRGADEAIHGLAVAAGDSGARAVALIPASLLLGLFIDGFVAAERGISRDRELVADAAGAEAATARSLGTALVKILAFSPQWDRVLEGMAEGKRHGTAVTNAATRFQELARAAAAPRAGGADVLAGLDARTIPHPTDSHPPLTQRLAALNLAQSELAAEALDVVPAVAADAVIAGRATYEVALTGWIEARLVASPPPA
jgi:Zn-dependent protease with chaperone function